MFEKFPFEEVGQKHNDCVRYLLANCGRKPDPDPNLVVGMAIKYGEAAGLIDGGRSQIVKDYLLTRVRSRWHLRTVGDLGLSKALLEKLNAFRANVGIDYTSTNLQRARTQLAKDAGHLSDFDRFHALLFGSVYQHSIDLWTGDDPYISTYASTHIFTDWGAVALADTVGVVGEAMTIGLMGVAGFAPPAFAAGAAAMAITGACASLLFYASGKATVVIEREPITPGPDGGDSGRPIG